MIWLLLPARHHRHCHCHHHDGGGSVGAWLVALVLFFWALPILVGIVVTAAVVVALWKGGWMLGRYIAGRRHP